MSIRAVARVMDEIATASGVIANNLGVAASHARGLPGIIGVSSARGGGSGSGGGGAGGASGGGSTFGAGGGSGSAGPLASREALWWLERLWRVETERLSWEKGAMPAGTVRRMHR